MQRVFWFVSVLIGLLAQSASGQHLAPVGVHIDPIRTDTIARVGGGGRPGTTLITGEAMIIALATDTKLDFEDQIKQADERAKQLRKSIGWQKGVWKIGQYLGGGGAMLFGFNDQGRNAAYAGSASALFTLADQVFSTNDKIEERAACREITSQFNAIAQTPNLWIAQAGDKAFQDQFPVVYAEFLRSSQAIVNTSKCDFALAKLRASIQTRLNAPPVRLP